MTERVPVQFDAYYAPLDVWTGVSAYPTADGGIAIFWRDVSERKRAEAAQRESEEWVRRRAAELEAVLDAVPTAVFITRDADARTMEANRYCAETLRMPRGMNVSKTGPSAGEVQGFRAMKNGVEIPPQELPMQVTARSGRPLRGCEFDLVFGDGETRHMLGNVTPLTGPDGVPAGAVGAFLDITDHKRAEVALREANEQLRDADRRKDDFLGMLSHELRNPLAPIRNSIYLMERTAPDHEAAQRGRAVIRRQTEHLARLVDDLLDVTRISHGKIELHRERLDARETVRKTTEDLHGVLEQAGIELRVDHLGFTPVWVDVDPTRLSQVIGNVLQNAAKFTPTGGTVTVSLTSRQGLAVLRVRDTGDGMDPGQVQRMFEPFVQAEQSLARSKGGLGLGLALVKGLVELHGGTVEGRSEGVGRGAEFIVRLPLAPPPSVGMAGRARAPAVRRRIVIIEDNVDAADTLAELLVLEGHDVNTARDARSGIALVRELIPDVVLCDLGLPDADGYDVARALRRDAALRGVRLIALSGYAQPEDRERARAAGFDGHMAKPPDLDELGRLLAAEP